MATTFPQTLGYLPVATASLCPATILNCDLFLQRKNSSLVELYRGRTYPIEASDLAKLRENGVRHLYIRLEDAAAYREYLCEHVLHDPDVPASVRVGALREVTRVVFEEALAGDDHDELVSIATEFGRGVASMMTEKSLVYRELAQILEHDFYTFTHVCNVSMYCVLLAHGMGESDPAKLSEIAAGALLHDIGKRHIPAQVLNKPGKLTDAEWELVTKHPLDGYLELAHRDDLVWGQLMMVYQHHERLDGSGYPAGIRGQELHPWSRICAVADVFDALTCHRPYRKAVALPDVCDHLKQHSGTWFDEKVVSCWLNQIRSEPG